MFKEALRGIEGIGIFPAISLIIFFTFFVILLVYTFTTRKQHIDHMSGLPLEDDHNEGLTPENKVQ